MTSRRRRGAAETDAKRDMVRRVGVAVRTMGAQSVITSRTVADHFGLNMTDLEVLDLIFLRGEASAGDLAHATGLTSGSVTALIDRLTTAGYVERAADPADGRRVLVRVLPEAIEPIKSMYLRMQEQSFALWSRHAAEELQLIEDFLVRSTEVAAACCRDLVSGAERKEAAGKARTTRTAKRSRGRRPPT